MLKLHQTLWRLNLPALLAVATVIAFTVLRVALLWRSSSEVPFNLPDLAGLFLRGLLFDTVVAAYVYGFFSLFGLLMPERLRKSVGSSSSAGRGVGVFVCFRFCGGCGVAFLE